jgi:hypothetical protein
LKIVQWKFRPDFLLHCKIHLFLFLHIYGKTKKYQMSVNAYHVFRAYMKGRASKEQMKVLWPTVKQSFQKLVGESEQAGDTNSAVAVRILERYGADVHLPTGDGGELPPSRPKRDLPNGLESLKEVLRTAGVSVGLAGAFHEMINTVKSAANLKTFVAALGDREAAMQTLATIGEVGIAVEPLVALIASLGVEEGASQSSGIPTQAGMMGAAGYAGALVEEGIQERKTSYKDSQSQRDLEEHLKSEIIERMKDPKVGVKQLLTEIDALQIPDVSKRVLRNRVRSRRDRPTFVDQLPMRIAGAEQSRITDLIDNGTESDKDLMDMIDSSTTLLKPMKAELKNMVRVRRGPGLSTSSGIITFNPDPNRPDLSDLSQSNVSSDPGSPRDSMLFDEWNRSNRKRARASENESFINDLSSIDASSSSLSSSSSSSSDGSSVLGDLRAPDSPQRGVEDGGVFDEWQGLIPRGVDPPAQGSQAHDFINRVRSQFPDYSNERLQRVIEGLAVGGTGGAVSWLARYPPVTSVPPKLPPGVSMTDVELPADDGIGDQQGQTKDSSVRQVNRDGQRDDATEIKRVRELVGDDVQDPTG